MGKRDENDKAGVYILAVLYEVRKYRFCSLLPPPSPVLISGNDSWRISNATVRFLVISRLLR